MNQISLLGSPWRLRSIILFFFFAVLAFFHNEKISLWDQDEAAYAGFSRTMLETNDFTNPNFLFSFHHRKPPLHFWMMALSFKCFGISPFSTRLPAVLFLLLTYFTLFRLTKLMGNEKTAFYSVAIAGTSLLLPVMAKISVTDAALVFFCTLAAVSVFKILQSPSFYQVLIFWVSIALGLLLKGPPILIFAMPFLAILWWKHPLKKNLLALKPLVFLPASMTPLLIWGYLSWKKDDGELVSFLVDWYVLKRVKGGVWSQTGPPGMHVVFILVAFLPWLQFIPGAISNIIRSFRFEKGNLLFLSIWFVTAWLPWEFSLSKLPAYTLAAHIPLSVFLGMAISNPSQPSKFWNLAREILMGVVLIGLSIAPGLLGLSGKIEIVFLSGFGLLFLIHFLTLFKPILFPFRVLVLNFALQFILWGIALPHFEPYKNASPKTAQFLNKNADETSIILISNPSGYPPSLPFYLGKYFKDVRVQENINVLYDYYKLNAPVALVLKKDDYDWFLWKFHGISGDTITSQYSNKFTDLTYFIVLNKAAQIDKNQQPVYEKN